jgi:hypothetical protein
VIESYEAGEWNFEDFANLVVGPGCSSGFGKYEKAIDLRIVKTASTAPAPPRRCPVADLVAATTRFWV